MDPYDEGAKPRLPNAGEDGFNADRYAEVRIETRIDS